MLQPAVSNATANHRPRLLLLEADTELGALLDPESFTRAKTALSAAWAPINTGPWQVGRLRDASPANAGLLVLTLGDCFLPC